MLGKMNRIYLVLGGVLLIAVIAIMLLYNQTSKTDETSEPPFLTYSGQKIGFNTQDPYWQNNASLNKLYDAILDTGVKWVRATLFWDLMEQQQGIIDWKQTDLIFDTIKEKGLKVVLVIRSAPSWAADGADTWKFHNYAPLDNSSYGEISYEVAKRYLNRDVEIVFELSNEQNMEFFNMPEVDPEQYTKNMLIPGATGIRKAADELGVETPTILVGGFAPVEPAFVPGSMTPFDFMTSIYEHGGQGYFDTIAYHPYTYVSGSTEDHWTFVELRKIIDLMDSKGDTNRKIWATEVGWATGTREGMVSEEEQATFTGEFFDYWFSLPYAGPVFWYELVDNISFNSDRENTFGLLYSTPSWPEKPAYSTFISKITEMNEAKEEH